MNFKLKKAGWNVRISWLGIDLKPIARVPSDSSDGGVIPRVSGRLRKAVTSWLTH